MCAGALQHAIIICDARSGPFCSKQSLAFDYSGDSVAEWLKLNSTTRTRPDPHGPNGVSPQKKSVRVLSGPCRVRVVEFSY